MNDNISALTRRLESENVSFSTDDKSLFDASLDHMRYSFLPDVVAYAECGEDIGKVLKTANELDVPVTVRGCGTGCSGGSVPTPGGIVLDLGAIDFIEIDPVARVAHVGAGAVTANVDAAAQNNVAWCYESGDGTEQNWSKALEWYTKSAENGCAIAQYSLAWMYDNGIEVKKNISKAIVWHIRAAENGYAMSQYKLGLAYLEGTVVDQNPIIANHWLMLAADQGVVFAQYKLAENYYFGIGCKRDVIKAKTMWILASNKGYSKAEEALEKYYDIYYNSDDKSFII